jgi:hypothetical protein
MQSLRYTSLGHDFMVFLFPYSSFSQTLCFMMIIIQSENTSLPLLPLMASVFLNFQFKISCCRGRSRGHWSRKQKMMMTLIRKRRRAHPHPSFLHFLSNSFQVSVSLTRHPLKAHKMTSDAFYFVMVPPLVRNILVFCWIIDEDDVIMKWRKSWTKYHPLQSKEEYILFWITRRVVWGHHHHSL